jgi:hypothetical protein
MRPGKRQKLQIRFGEITIGKVRKIEETHAHYRAGKYTLCKIHLPEIAAVKLVVGKINILKVHSGNAYIFYGFVLGDEGDNPVYLLLLVCLMEKTNMGAAYCGPSAACCTGANGKHS